jgi:hypothetical protein
LNLKALDTAGENTVAAILAARNRKISLVKPGAKRASPARLFEEIIALKLAEMGLIKEFKVNPISDQRQEYEVKIRTRGSRDWVDLPDVGFGISQVLPVLVQCYLRTKGVDYSDGTAGNPFAPQCPVGAGRCND